MTEGVQPQVAFFDSPEQQYSSDYPSKNYSLKTLVGVVYKIDSPFHSSASLDHIVGVYNLPYNIEPLPDTSDLGLTITNVDKNGTVELSYENESFYVEPGSNWTSPIVSTYNLSQNLTFPINGSYYKYALCFNRTYELENKGLFNK